MQYLLIFPNFLIFANMQYFLIWKFKHKNFNQTVWMINMDSKFNEFINNNLQSLKPNLNGMVSRNTRV